MSHKHTRPGKTTKAGRAGTVTTVARQKSTALQEESRVISARLADVREHIHNLRKALAGLTDLGLCIAGVDLLNGRGKPVLEMAPSPYLHRICTPVNIGRKQIGNTRFVRFAAEFSGVTLAWWESSRKEAA